MSRALVVYESVFGDARAIAHAVADGLSTSVQTDVVSASEAPAEIDGDVRLLVVGGPNHALGMPRPTTREGAVKQSPPPAVRRSRWHRTRPRLRPGRPGPRRGRRPA